MPTLYLAIDARKMKEGAKDAKDASDNVTDATEKTSKSLDKLKERASKAWDILKGLFKAMVAGATAIFGAASAFVALNVATASTIDNLADTAQALQITVEQVSLLEYAADRAGTNLGEISGAIRAVASQAQAFSAGDEKAIGLFRLLGVDPTGQDPIALTSAVATAIGNVEDKTQKLALAQDLLGRSGFKVIELFKDQGAGFRDVAEDARRLGAIVDEKLVKIAANLVDTWGDVKKAIIGVSNEILRQAGPDLTDFLKKLSDNIARSRFDIGAFFGALAKSANEIIEIIKSGGLLDSLSAISRFFSSEILSLFVNVTPAIITSATALGTALGAAIIQGVINGIADRLPDLVTRFSGLSGLLPDEYNPIRKLAESFADVIKTSPESLRPFIDGAQKTIIASWSGVGDALQSDLQTAYREFLSGVDTDTAERIKRIVQYFRDIPKVAREAKEAYDLDTRNYGIGIGAPPGSPPLERKDISERLKAIESIERLIRAKEDEIKLIGLSDQEREKAVFGIEAERHAFELSTAEIDRAKDAYGRLVDEITAANKTYQLSRSIAEPIGNGVEEAILHFESLRDVGLSVYEDLRRAAVRSFITNPLIESLTSGINSGLSGLNLFGSARGNVFSGGHVLPFAMGGVLNQASYMPMADGRTAMAGESRSELVVAPIRRTSRGEIGLSVEGTGGQSLTFNMHYHGNGSRQDQDGFRQSARQVVDDAKRRLQI